jgi:hypothetical protein
MGPKTKTNERLSVDGRWDGLDFIGRIKMILHSPDHFLSLGLITRDELDRVMATSETEWEYVVDRGYPMFQNINIKAKTYTQPLQHLFRTALKAVFL